MGVLPRFFDGLRPTLHIAHRGGALLAPENTLAAFRMAVERYRTDMLELDVHLCADGELVVSHDPTVDRCTDGTGAIASMNLAELRKLDAGFRFTPDGGATFPFRGRDVGLPTLREVLRAFPSLRMNIELKPGQAGAEEAFASLIREEGATARVCIGSESDALGARLYEAIPEACHFFPLNTASTLIIGIKSGEEIPTDERFHVLDMPLTWEGIPLVDEPFLRAISDRGRWVNVWTVNDAAEMRRLRALRVGGIMTDRPDLLRQVLDEGAPGATRSP